MQRVLHLNKPLLENKKSKFPFWMHYKNVYHHTFRLHSTKIQSQFKHDNSCTKNKYHNKNNFTYSDIITDSSILLNLKNPPTILKQNMMDFNKIINTKMTKPHFFHLLKNSKEMKELIGYKNAQINKFKTTAEPTLKNYKAMSFPKSNEIKNILENGTQFYRNLDYANYFPNDFFPKPVLIEQILEMFGPQLIEENVNKNQQVPSKKNILPSLEKNKSQKKIISSNENINQLRKLHLEKSSKEESLIRNLQSYLNLCVSCGFVNKAYSTFLYYRNVHRTSSKLKLQNIDVYNTLLHGFAYKGDIEKINDILNLIKEDKISLNPQSYAAIYECFGRMNNSQNKKVLKKYYYQMINDKIDFNDIFNKCTFYYDQREIIMKIAKILDPKFELILTEPSTKYLCPLLESLNDESKSKLIKPNIKNQIISNNIKQFKMDQMNMEKECYVKIKSIEKTKEKKEIVINYREKLAEIQKTWKEKIIMAFKRDVNSLKSQNQSLKLNKHMNIYPFLQTLDAEIFSELILNEINKLAEGSESYSPPTSQLYKEFGYQIWLRYQVEIKKKNGVLIKTDLLYDKYCDWYSSKNTENSFISREKWQRLIYEHPKGPSIDKEDKIWPNTVLLNLGKFFYNIIMKDIQINSNLIKHKSKIDNMIPAFYSVYRTTGKTFKEEVKPHPIVSRLYRGAAQEYLVFDVTKIPMLSPPIPWTNIYSGGYIISKSNLIRLPLHAVQQLIRMTDNPNENLYPIFDSLNQLASTPWIINKRMLDTVIQVFNDGGDDKLDIPCSPSDVHIQEMIYDKSASKVEKYKQFRMRMIQKRKKAEMYSLWCDTLYKLSLANHFRDRIFWFPHNLDFRGRVYPCPPHLNHLGSDMSRSILLFADGACLGPKGLDWLKIHLINLLGTMKNNSIAERLQYANDNLDLIIDSANNPLKGKKWWMNSDEPWQTLACCMEIAEAIKSDNPSRYVSHFPIHQDGSCNGLQHYAALGRDSIGAESVNLSFSPNPQDVYSCVVTKVEEARVRDAKNGLPIAQTLEGFIKRKVIKQTIMTTVYGVTRYGARLQIAKQLKDIDDFPKEHIWGASNYLVIKTFESLREMFSSTKEIQDWFTECARLISSVREQNVEWVTPLGLPIVQPYYRITKNFNHYSKKKIQEYSPLDMFERPNIIKQKNAFPPNFIHSLDSSHMMLTSLFCERAGISFVSVHDCFWTHPSTVHIMNEICREQFVSLHSQPILKELSNFLKEKFGFPENEIKSGSDHLIKKRLNDTLVDLPSTGDFNLENVLKSVYFFS